MGLASWIEACSIPIMITYYTQLFIVVNLVPMTRNLLEYRKYVIKEIKVWSYFISFSLYLIGQTLQKWGVQNNTNSGVYIGQLARYDHHEIIKLTPLVLF